MPRRDLVPRAETVCLSACCTAVRPQLYCGVCTFGKRLGHSYSCTSVPVVDPVPVVCSTGSIVVCAMALTRNPDLARGLHPVCVWLYARGVAAAYVVPVSKRKMCLQSSTGFEPVTS